MNTQDRPATRLTFLQRHSFLPRFSPDGENILFTMSGHGRCNIYRMNVEGGDLQCLTTGEGLYSDPVFSPDGTQIAYIASHPFYEECHDIAVMNADGTDQRTLTTTHKESAPIFSPDGQQIVFVSGRDRALEIYRMQADGTGQQRLTFVEDRPEQRVGSGPRNRSPVSSPDGSTIVFVAVPLGPSHHPKYAGRCVQQPAQIHYMRYDGTQRKPLYTLEGSCDDPMFSPDGTWLAFRNWQSPGRGASSICLIRPDGSAFIRLPESQGIWASFHPEGNRIIFTSSRDRKSEQAPCKGNLYCIDLRNGALQRLSENEARDNCPTFSPDGTQIVFCSDRDGYKEIYTMPF